MHPITRRRRVTRLRRPSKRTAVVLGAVATVVLALCATTLRASLPPAATSHHRDTIRTVADASSAAGSAAAGSDVQDTNADNAQAALVPDWSGFTQCMTDIDNCSASMLGLTQPEFDYCKQDLGKCYAAQESRTFAFADDKQVAGVTTSKLNDQSDAARHCLWQLHLTIWFGADYATGWGNAHEQNNDPMETHAMDFHNNIVARSLAADPTLQSLKNQAVAAASDSGNGPETGATTAAVDQRIEALCTTAVRQAVQVTYAPPTSAVQEDGDLLTPYEPDNLVYLTPNS
jgi:hypothetical protein